MSKRNLYRFIALLTFASICWLTYSFSKTTPETSTVVLCPVKQVAGIPCPACGTTRSVQSILSGNLTGAAHINPLGFFALLALIIVPFWVFYDSLTGKEGFYRFYNRFESMLKTRYVAFPMVLLVLINWYWNIAKGL